MSEDFGTEIRSTVTSLQFATVVFVCKFLLTSIHMSLVEIVLDRSFKLKESFCPETFVASFTLEVNTFHVQQNKKQHLPSNQLTILSRILGYFLKNDEKCFIN